jgi:cytochrome c556
MKLSRIAAALILALSIPAAVHADPGGDKPKTPLDKEMGGIAKDFRALRKQVQDPAQKDSSLQLVKDMEDHAAKAHDLTPSKAKDIPEAQRAQFIADFQKAIDGLSDEFKKLEAQIGSGDTAGAAATLDEIQSTKRDGHKKFNAD